MKIIIDDNKQWDDSFSIESIQNLLDVTYKSFSDMTGYHLKKNIIVRNRPDLEDRPMILYYNEPSDYFIIELNTPNTKKTGQIIYQFSHEVCHAFCKFNDYRNYKQKWFEETLCEAASLSNLYNLSINYSSYKRELELGCACPASFTMNHLEEYCIKDVIKGLSMLEVSSFIDKHNADLENDQYLRKLNKVVAVYLCEQVFFKNPKRWKALKYYNSNYIPDNLSLSELLSQWKSNGDGNVKAICTSLGF